MEKKNFSKQKELIEKYIKPKKKLEECTETCKLLNEENENNNPYVLLGRLFELYNQCEDINEEHSDWYFFKYLKSLKKQDSYTFSIDGEEIIVNINLLEPYIEIKKDDKLQKVINPQWHLMVAHYAYIDAMYNHDDNEYAREIKNAPGHPSGRFGFRCKSLKKWIEEAF